MGGTLYRDMANAIVLAFDDGFAHYAVACLNSISLNYPNHPSILIQYDGCSAGVEAAIDRIGGRQLAATGHVRSAFAGAPGGPVGSALIYDRFAIWADGLPAYDKVLYLDADTLVLKPLDGIFERDRFLAVANHEPTEFVRVFDPASAGDRELHRLLREDGIPYPSRMDDMINAGVMMIPRSYRNVEQYERILHLYRRYRIHLHYADQSLLSLWCAANGIRPDTCFQYNFQSPFFTDPEIDIAFEDIHVLHFSGTRKPPTPHFRTWQRVGDAALKCEALFELYLNAYE